MVKKWELDAARRVNDAASQSEKQMLEMISDLAEALKPFATAEATEDMDFRDDTSLFNILSGDKVTLGDLRRARAALSKAQGGE